MSESEGNRDSEVSLEAKQRVDRLCDVFEQQWIRGGRPRIEEFLDQLPDIEIDILLRELIAVELERRRAANENPAREEYIIRFPGHVESVQAAFNLVSESVTGDGSTIALTDTEGRAGEEDNSNEDQPKKIGRYLIRRRLGGGGFGVVYLAHDSQLNRAVALKVPRARRFTTAEAVKSFVQDAQTAAQLKHPALVAVYDVQIQENGLPYIIQEYIDGLSLDQWSKSNHPPPNQIVRLLVKVTEAVGFAHQQNIWHRDLKMANILVDHQGQPHVADFGLAIHETAQRDRKGEVAGSPAWMAPEQIRGETHHFDGRTDIWALGVILYELLTGRRPFQGSNLDELFEEIKSKDPRPPRQLVPALPSELERICLKCLQRRRKDRYSSAAELLDDLNHWDIVDAKVATQKKPKTATETSSSNVLQDGLQPSARARLESGLELGNRGCNFRFVITVVVLCVIAPGLFTLFHINNAQPEGDVRAEIGKLNAQIKVDSQDNIIAVFADNTAISDVHLMRLARENSIVKLSLRQTKVTDVGLSHLFGLKNLREIDLADTLVTKKGVSRLRDELPDCMIIWQNHRPE